MGYVGPEGPRDARIAIVGEKPGRYEMQTGRPFIGPSGRELNDLLQRIGISRSHVYLTNAVKNADDFENPTIEDIEREQLSLYQELLSLPHLTTLVPMGTIALAACSNFQHVEREGKGTKSNKLVGIMKYRGSILRSFLGTKMIPTIHPAFYMRGEMRYRSVVRFDLARALEESRTPALNLPERGFNIAPASIQEVREWVRYLALQRTLSFDIETFRGSFISCIAFSSDPLESFCIPFMKGDYSPYWSPEEEIEVWGLVQGLLANPKVRYVTQNGLFDCWHLWRHGIVTPYMANGFDTMYAHKVLTPSLPHDLGFLVSIYTREPFYKDESGSWSSDVRVPDNQFWVYNSKDASCTLEVANAIAQEMLESKQLKNYQMEVQAQWPVLMDMRQRGLRVDYARLNAAREQLCRELGEREASLSAYLGGWTPNIKSKPDLVRLFDMLGITLGSGDRTPTGQPKLNEERMRVYANRWPQHRDMFMTMLAVSKARTFVDGFLSLKTDPDGFYHPSYKLTHTVTGRLASEGADEGGPQIQNIPKALRSLFVPDAPESLVSIDLGAEIEGVEPAHVVEQRTEPGHIFLSADLKQAEAMIVAWLSEDPLLIEAFSTGVDVHQYRACIIYRGWRETTLPPTSLLKSIKVVCGKCEGKGEKECPHSERQVAKKSGHAFAYKMGIHRFLSELRIMGVFMNDPEARAIQNLMVTAYVRRWHDEVYQMLRRDAWLETPLGRRREFYGVLDDDTLRDALSWLAQATVSQITNRAIIALHKHFTSKEWIGAPRPRVVTQTHDSALVNTHPRHEEEAIAALRASFHCPMTIKGRPLTIPIEIVRGSDWGHMKEIV